MKLLLGMINMAITGSLVFLMFIGMEQITKHFFSAAWHYGILKFIMLYFCIPFGLLNKYLIYSVIFRNYMDIIPEVGVIPLSDAMQQVSSFLSLHKALYIELVMVWTFGLAALSIRQIICYLKFRSIIAANKRPANIQIQKTANLIGKQLGIKKTVQVYVNEFINTPMLIGFIAPVIILPSDNMQLSNVKYVISHELTHYKSKDLFFKLGMLFIRIICWFNPFVYLFTKKFDKWCEYACDEKNAINLPLDMKKKYGLAILEAAALSPIYGSDFAAPFLLPKQNLKERLMFMLKVKRMQKKVIIFSFAAAAALLTLGLVGTTADEFTRDILFKGNNKDIETDSFISSFDNTITESYTYEKPLLN